MLARAKQLTELSDLSLEGDIQIVLAVLSDELRYVDPLNDIEHIAQVEWRPSRPISAS